MLWRDDNTMTHIWYDGETFRFVSMRLELDRYMRIRYPFHIYQSFLLDYIEYLFETAIDRRLANEQYGEESREYSRQHDLRNMISQYDMATLSIQHGSHHA